MADLKKTQFNTVDEDIVSMEFDKNPNIPTANYSDETLLNIQDAIQKKMRAEKIKKMIETELRRDKKTESLDEMSLSFSFKGM